jgi:hypothetical protein
MIVFINGDFFEEERGARQQIVEAENNSYLELILNPEGGRTRRTNYFAPLRPCG